MQQLQLHLFIHCFSVCITWFCTIYIFFPLLFTERAGCNRHTDDRTEKSQRLSVWCVWAGAHLVCTYIFFFCFILSDTMSKWLHNILALCRKTLMCDTHKSTSRQTNANFSLSYSLFFPLSFATIRYAFANTLLSVRCSPVRQHCCNRTNNSDQSDNSCSQISHKHE